MMNLVKLGELCNKITDGTHHTPTYTTEGVPFLRVTDITKSNDSKKFISREEHLALIKRCNPEKGDILYTKNGTIGVAKQIDWDYEFSIFVSLCLLKIKEEIVYANYLVHYLNTQYALKQALTHSKKATITNLHLIEIKKIKIPLPPLPQQKKIAAILDAADAYRQKTKALITKYEELTQSLFLEMFGDLVNNQKGWNYTQFGNIFKSLRYGTSSPPKYSNNGIAFVRATNIKNGGIAKKGLVFISQEEADKIQKCKLQEGDLIIVRSGANTGDCSRIPKEYEGAYGGFDIIVEIDEPFSSFYNFLLNTPSAKAVLQPLTRRAGQPHLNSKQITKLGVFEVPINLQTQFAERVQAIEAQKAQAQSSLAQAEDLFNCLLQQAFKGELLG